MPMRVRQSNKKWVRECETGEVGRQEDRGGLAEPEFSSFALFSKERERRFIADPSPHSPSFFTAMMTPLAQFNFVMVNSSRLSKSAISRSTFGG